MLTCTTIMPYTIIANFCCVMIMTLIFLSLVFHSRSASFAHVQVSSAAEHAAANSIPEKVY